MFNKDLKEKIEYIGMAVAELIKEVKEIKEQLRKKYVSEIFGFKDEESFSKFLKICDDIAKKDESFKFESGEMRIFLYSYDKDELHKKSMWLIKNTGIDGIYYSVREK
ncbi:MAG: hypothetical protein NZ942_02895 [Candidatus Aenigmarchaeota archaeon]|nr:hypothetical protein [Candidatus Aenigmarchaeota archaeon]